MSYNAPPDNRPLTNEYGEILPDAIPNLDAIPALPPGTAGDSTRKGVPARTRRIIGIGAIILFLVLFALGAVLLVLGLNKSSPIAAATATAVVLSPTPSAPDTAPSGTITPTIPKPTATPNTAIAHAYTAAVQAFERGDPKTCSQNMAMVVADDPRFQNTAVAYLFICYQALADQQISSVADLEKAPDTYNRAIALYSTHAANLKQQFKANPKLLPQQFTSLESWAASLQVNHDLAQYYANGYASDKQSNYAAAAKAWTHVYDLNKLYLDGKTDPKVGDLAIRSQLILALYNLAAQRCHSGGKAFDDAAQANQQALAIANDGNTPPPPDTLDLLKRQKDAIAAKTACGS